MQYIIRFKDQSSPVFFDESKADEYAARFSFDAKELMGEETDIELLDADNQIVGWVLPA